MSHHLLGAADASDPADPLDVEVARAVESAERRSPDSRSRRVLDLVVCVPLVLLTLPLVLVLATISACTFRAWPFFVHSRVGRGGKPFRFAKIRSLPADVPEYIDKYALRSRMGSGWSVFIRGTHLDELPQLWHVLSGKMSLVGPRPEMVPISGRFDPGFGRARVLVRPGCTGLWQVSATNAKLIGEAPHYDLFYLRFASVRLDLWVLWHTLTDLLPGDRPVSLVDIPAAACGVDAAEARRYDGLDLRPAWRTRREIRLPMAETLEKRPSATVEGEVPVYSERPMPFGLQGQPS